MDEKDRESCARIYLTWQWKCGSVVGRSIRLLCYLGRGGCRTRLQAYINFAGSSRQWSTSAEGGAKGFVSSFVRTRFVGRIWDMSQAVGESRGQDLSYWQKPWERGCVWDGSLFFFFLYVMFILSWGDFIHSFFSAVYARQPRKPFVREPGWLAAGLWPCMGEETHFLTMELWKGWRTKVEEKPFQKQWKNFVWC